MEYPFVLGTSGHIDHGKTALVRAMTGVDCDRLGEEKRRGITIVLGFAPLELPSGRTVSIIDVPGHEKFIRHMTAGAAGLDAVMLVIAADEGVMPQTREHLDILRILGVEHGMIAITKKDLVDDEMLALAESDARDLVRGTFLEGAPVMAVSSATLEGVDALKEEIDRLVSSTKERVRSGAFFLPIDRTFTVKGFGSVITGTSWRGELCEGDDVDIVPPMIRTKVRGIQIHGASEGKAVAGQRTAVNLAGVSLDSLSKGDAVAAAGRYEPTSCIGVKFEILPTAPSPLKHWQRVHLHIGTADVVARVSLFSSGEGKPEIQPGGSGIGMIITDEPVAAVNLSRFVIRQYSPLITIGGGTVLSANSPRPESREARTEAAAALERMAAAPDERGLVETIVRERGVISTERLYALSQLEEKNFDRALKASIASSDAQLSVSHDGSLAVSRDAFERIARTAREALDDFHGRHPELAGLGADELAGAVSKSAGDRDAREMSALLSMLADRKLIVRATSGQAAKFAAPGFKQSGGDKLSALAEALMREAASAGYEMIDASEAAKRLKAPPTEISRAIGALRERGEMHIAGGTMLLPESTRQQALDALRSIEGEITLAAFRDKIGTSRKYALPLLEFFDSSEVTRRVGDKRVLLKGK